MFQSQSRSKEYLLDHLWILERHSGNCFFEYDFNSDGKISQFPSDVASSFFMAFSRFIDQIYSDKIKKIKFQNRKLYFKVTEELVFITSIKNIKKLNDSKIETLISKIISNFYHLYSQKMVDQKCFSKISDFHGFIDTLEELER